MPIKTTHTSSHPDFTSFPDWFDQRMEAANALGDMAEFQKMQAAKNAFNAIPAVPISSFERKDTADGAQIEVVRAGTGQIVPEFNEYIDLWRSTFNVVTVDEEV